MYYGTYQRLNLHVGTSFRDVIRACRGKLKKSARRARKHKEARKVLYRACLYNHAMAGRLYRLVVCGQIG